MSEVGVFAYRDYVLHNTPFGVVVKTKAGGVLPDMLTGLWSTYGTAKQQIDVYLDHTKKPKKMRYIDHVRQTNSESRDEQPSEGASD